MADSKMCAFFQLEFILQGLWWVWDGMFLNPSYTVSFCIHWKGFCCPYIPICQKLCIAKWYVQCRRTMYTTTVSWFPHGRANMSGFMTAHRSLPAAASSLCLTDKGGQADRIHKPTTAGSSLTLMNLHPFPERPQQILLTCGSPSGDNWRPFGSRAGCPWMAL